MTRSLTALLLACACATAMSAAGAREIGRLSPGDRGCPADVAAAKAEAEGEERPDAVPSRTAGGDDAPVRARPTVRGTDAPASGHRLQAPRWHSFLPGMFR